MNLLDRLGKQVLVFDGAMGTQLQARGLPPGYCPDLWCLERPEVVEAVHRDYVDAGAMIVETNTFGSIRCRLDHYQAGHLVREINVAAVRIARKAAEGRALVAASVGPTGWLIDPLGEYTFDQVYEQYAEQARALAEAEPDFIIIETIADLNELRAAVMACRDHAPNIKRIAQITIDPTGRAFTGTDPETAVVVLQSLGADIIGLNCSVGPKELVGAVERMAKVAKVPISVLPNAGLPLLDLDGNTFFPLGPQEFAEWAPKLVAAGASLVGGCCGTTPEHIRLLRGAVENLPIGKPKESLAGYTVFASRTRSLFLTDVNLPLIIGERINPTGRKKFSAEIAANNYATVRKEAKDQVAAGAHLLDVNVGVPLIDEAAAMFKAVQAVQDATDAPLVIDSPDVLAVEAGLKATVGKPMINSVSLEEGRPEAVFPLAKKWGANILGLTIDENGIPAGAKGRFEVAKRLVRMATEEYGIPLEDIIIDPLCLTAGAQQSEAKETLKAIQLIKSELGVKTSLGISNISFGLPNRHFLNAIFLNMAFTMGLDMAIMNPMDERMVDTTRAVRLFQNRDRGAREYMKYYGTKPLYHSEADVAKELKKQGKVVVDVATLQDATDAIARALGDARPAAKPPSGGAAGGAPGGAASGGAAGAPGNQGGAASKASGSSASGAAKQERPDLGGKPPWGEASDPAEAKLRQGLYTAILEGDKDGILDLVEAWLTKGLNPMEMLNGCLIPAIEEVGRLFGEGTYFLPQLMLSATAMKKAFVRVKPELEKLKSGTTEVGTIVLATVQGDIHDIGKNICAVLLENYGFKVIDLGRDVKNEIVIEEALKQGADLVGLSALMTTTMPQMKKIIDAFASQGIPMPVLVGGAATTRHFADAIGASGYGRDAQEAVSVALQVLEQAKGKLTAATPGGVQ